MKCKDMSEIVCPLEILLGSDDSDSKKIKSIGIGDGGNEVGMGKVYDEMILSTIPDAPDIACVVPTDHLLVSSVSNWGGYALCAASVLYDIFLNASCDEIEVDNIHEQLDQMLPTNEEELMKCTRMIEAGARDGLTGEKAMTVDGMPLQASLEILNKLRRII